MPSGDWIQQYNDNQSIWRTMEKYFTKFETFGLKMYLKASHLLTPLVACIIRCPEVSATHSPIKCRFEHNNALTRCTTNFFGLWWRWSHQYATTKLKRHWIEHYLVQCPPWSITTGWMLHDEVIHTSFLASQVLFLDLIIKASKRWMLSGLEAHYGKILAEVSHEASSVCGISPAFVSNTLHTSKHRASGREQSMWSKCST